MKLLDITNLVFVVIIYLLRLGWLAGTIPILIASYPSTRPHSFHHFITLFANRGKTQVSKRYTVPQRFFLHFYVVAVSLTTVLLLGMWVFATNLTEGSYSFSAERRYVAWRTVFVLFLMEMQVLRRLYETLFVFKYGSSARMHIMGYLTGLYFYTAAPLSICATSAPEVVNSVIHLLAEFVVSERDIKPSFELDMLKYVYVSPLTKLGQLQWIGAGIFLWGWIHQQRCHEILGSLRQHKKQTDEYAVPHGDWFEVVSCPHYLAEIVIYAGILIASGGLDLTMWLLFGFVVANLVFSAAETQRWYIHKFETYPQKRYAILPFIY